eukprot:7289644-Pyramimonas_sp.AAC.1
MDCADGLAGAAPGKESHLPPVSLYSSFFYGIWDSSSVLFPSLAPDWNGLSGWGFLISISFLWVSWAPCLVWALPLDARSLYMYLCISCALGLLMPPVSPLCSLPDDPIAIKHGVGSGRSGPTHFLATDDLFPPLQTSPLWCNRVRSLPLKFQVWDSSSSLWSSVPSCTVQCFDADWQVRLGQRWNMICGWRIGPLDARVEWSQVEK